MGEISLDQPYNLQETLCMAITNKAFDDLLRCDYQPLDILMEITSLEVLIFIPQNNGIYKLYTRKGNFLISFPEESDSGDILLTTFRKNRLRDNNDCLRRGVSIHCGGGYYITVKNKRAQVYCDIYNGHELRDEDRRRNYFQNDSSTANQQLKEYLDAQGRLSSKWTDNDDERQENLEQSDEFIKFLDVAETYAAVDSDIERAAAQQIPPLSYFDLQPAEDNARLDRVAYRLSTSDFDEAEYCIDKKVQLERDEAPALGATIKFIEKTPAGNSVTLLFDDQVSYSSLPKTGIVRPSYSDVQYEVRTKVIDGLRNGYGPAKSLDKVLGSFQTAGFEKKDLRDLDESLESKKYPPNASQIEAIHKGINTRDILLVMGPPGTGKTTVILEWVKYFIKVEKKRVLISSQNNKAVDNVLERLTEEKDIDAIRAGNEIKVQANLHPYLFENRIKDLGKAMEEQTSDNLQHVQAVLCQYEALAVLAKRMETLQTRYAAHIKYLHSRVEALSHEPRWYLQTLGVRQNELLAEMRKARSNLKILEAHLAPRMPNAWLQKCMFIWGGVLDALRSTKKQTRSNNTHQIVLFCKSIIRKLHMLWNKLWAGLKMFVDWIRHFRHDYIMKRIGETERQYELLYNDYVSIRNQRQAAYKSLTKIVTDSIVLEEATQMASLEIQLEDQKSAFFSAHIDDDIFPAVTWSGLNGKGSDSTSKVLSLDISQAQSQIALRVKRLKALEVAVEEWHAHVQTQSNYALSDLLMESVDLVGGTCIGINSQRKFEKVDFDVTIIDEAGQIQIHNVLVPMSRSPKVIMLGDHKQIPPISDKEHIDMTKERQVDESLWETSLFEWLYNKLPEENKIMLDTQYRMPAQLGDLLSKWFYEDKYKSFSGKKNMPSISPLFNSPFVIVDTSAELNRHEYKPEMGAGNHLEANLVADIVCCLTDPNGPDMLSSEQFGIISPYGEQVENMRRTIRARHTDLSEEQIHEMVASLDSFQGQERDVILYSCTRSNTIPPTKPRIGFMSELRRLNVALSRPKKQLVFIGDIKFLSECKFGEGEGSERKFSEFIRLMMKHVADDGECIPAAELRRRVGAYYG